MNLHERIHVKPGDITHKGGLNFNQWFIEKMNYGNREFKDVIVNEYPDGSMTSSGVNMDGRKPHGSTYQMAMKAIQLWVKIPCRELQFAEMLKQTIHETIQKREILLKEAPANSHAEVLARGNLQAAKNRLERVQEIIKRLNEENPS